MVANKSVKNKRRLLEVSGFLAFMIVGAIILANMPVGAVEKTSQENGLVLKSYPCPAQNIESTTKQLKEIFQGRSDVRITANARTAQILIYAPPEVQSQIFASMGGVKQGDLSTANSLPATGGLQPSANTQVDKSASFSLRNLSAMQIEQTLMRMM